MQESPGANTVSTRDSDGKTRECPLVQGLKVKEGRQECNMCASRLGLMRRKLTSRNNTKKSRKKERRKKEDK